MAISDNKALVAKLFRRYEINIRKFLMRKTYQKEDVEDIVQETFLKAHKVSEWNEVKNPEAFLVSIAKNTYKDHIRKETRRISYSDVDISRLELTDEAPSPEQTLSGQQEIQELEFVINSLTPRVKQAIVLIKILNSSYAEASEIMNVSLSTLESHVAKGMSECRKKMQAQMAYSGLPELDDNIFSLSQHKSSKR